MATRKRRLRQRRPKRRRLSLREKQTRNNAFKVLNDLRIKGSSLTRAAREVGISPRSVIRHVGTALNKQSNGRYAAKRSDRLTRYLEFLTPQGSVTLKVQGSRKASLIGEYSNAVKLYLETGDSDGLEKFRNKAIQVGKELYPFVTDLRTLERLGNAGVLSFENLYALSA